MSAPRATLVLVHGAWHGSWCWERLIPLLAERGVATRTVDLPSVHGSSRKEAGNEEAGCEDAIGKEASGEEAIGKEASGDETAGKEEAGERPAGAGPHRSAGLRDDASAVREVIDAIEGPVVLCGHSYGGMVISLAASRAGSGRPVTRLIYLCAFMPERRQSLVGIGGNQHAPWIRMLDGDLTLPDLALAGEVFYGDCDARTRAWAIARLRPQYNAAFITPVARPAWQEIPSTYIVCTRDGAMPPELQRTLFAPRAERSIELDASHSPFLSRPAALADALAAEI